MTISGDKIILTAITMDDLDFISGIECDQQLWYYEESVQSDVLAVRERYAEKIKSTDEPTSYYYIVTRTNDSSKRPIGFAKIRSYIFSRKSWEIGYCILPEFGGKEYGTEAGKLLLQFAFEQLEAHKVVGMCNAKNSRSAGILEHIGMTREAIFKEELFWHDEWTDQYYYSILDKEYK
ncbi:GNAT family N-acetyltransferase [Paenibacillus selenitireducens]|uniref:GNAT family N-acetyltransferase n=2 Tax=Paenibacillus selenitireducens TaxID=1324314 RepID=A0A1T2X6C1_9BACL|nr:GNAT family N-acetyltransferase [Paenibacillus selenitireducens]